jgi:hypothetical protein
VKKLFFVLLVLLAELTRLRADRHRQRLSTRNEFETLAAGRIVIAVRDHSTISRSCLKAVKETKGKPKKNKISL